MQGADDRLRRHQRRVVRYSRLVRWMKIALPVGAVLLIGLIFMVERERAAVFDAGSAAQLAAVGTGMRLDKPRLSGVTEDGDPFVVTAEWALPDGAMPDRIDLEKPVGELQMGGQTVTVTAATGELWRQDERLHLEGEVELVTSDGYRVRTPRVEVDLAARTAEAPSRIHAEGPRGGIEADRVSVLRGEGKDDMTVRFEGNVRVNWQPATAGDSAPDSAVAGPDADPKAAPDADPDAAPDAAPSAAPDAAPSAAPDAGPGAAAGTADDASASGGNGDARQ